MRPQKYLMVTVIVAVCVVCLSGLPLQAAVRGPLTQPYGGSDSIAQAFSWSDVAGWFQRQRVPGGSRGPSSDVKVCGILPGVFETADAEDEEVSTLPEDLEAAETEGETDRSNQIWNPNPVFLWQEDWATLEVKDGRSHEVMLSQTLAPGQRTLAYDQVAEAKPLEPGRVYYWKIENSEYRSKPIYFVPMGVEEHAEMSAALASLETQGTSEDDILRERVGFFLEQDLAADAFREIYLAPNPPEDLVMAMEAIQAQDFCENFEGLTSP